MQGGAEGSAERVFRSLAVVYFLLFLLRKIEEPLVKYGLCQAVPGLVLARPGTARKRAR